MVLEKKCLNSATWVTRNDVLYSSPSSFTTLTLSWNVSVRISLVRYKQNRPLQWNNLRYRIYTRVNFFCKRLSVSGTETSGLSNFVLKVLIANAKYLFFRIHWQRNRLRANGRHGTQRFILFLEHNFLMKWSNREQTPISVGI